MVKSIQKTRDVLCTVRGELSAFVVMLKHSSDVTQLRGFTDVKHNCEAFAILLTRPNVLLAFFYQNNNKNYNFLEFVWSINLCITY